MPCSIRRIGLFHSLASRLNGRLPWRIDAG
jgi:hypothetical protein